MITQPNRNFAVGFVIPKAKLNHIIHPRYGKVYPVLCINRKQEWPNLARFSTTALSIINFSIFYSAFCYPLYTAEASAIFANPLFFIPSIALNYILYKRHYSLFYGDRSIITNIFMMDDGK